jgi:uncharacterized protein
MGVELQGGRVPVLDADSHIVLPPGDDWWQRHLAKKYWEWMPRYSPDDQGVNRLVAEGRVIKQPTPTLHGKPTADSWFGESQASTYSPGSWRPDAEKRSMLEALRAGGLKPQERLSAMDGEGVDLAYVFPSKVLGLLPALTSSSFALAVARAYNDWLFEYCSANHGRLRGVAMVPQQDLILAAEEAVRVHEKGIAAVMLRPNTVAGMNVDHPSYDRLWRVCEERNLPVLIHEGYGVADIPRVGVERVHSTLQGHMVSHPFEHMMACMLLITSGVFERFPRLRVAFMESGATWAPFWLNRMDAHMQVFAKDHPPLAEKPSTYFRRQCFLGIDPDDALLDQLVSFGLEDNLVFATDFPHFDAPFPGAVNGILERSWPDAVKKKVLFENGARLYGLSSTGGLT